MLTIGLAYGDIQTQCQKLLQQITERDDYNMKQVDWFVYKHLKLKHLELMREVTTAKIREDIYFQNYMKDYGLNTNLIFARSGLT